MSETSESPLAAALASRATYRSYSGLMRLIRDVDDGHLGIWADGTGGWRNDRGSSILPSHMADLIGSDRLVLDGDGRAHATDKGRAEVAAWQQASAAARAAAQAEDQP
jgi:hypothetical protein